MKITGFIKRLFDTYTVGANGFTKRDIIIQTVEKHPQIVKIEFISKKCALLDPFTEGEEVEIDVNIRGREWVNPDSETVYFTSIQGWRIKEIGTARVEQPQQQAIDVAPKYPADEDDDDLPF